MQPSVSPRLSSASPRLTTPDNLLQLIAKITVDDINGAERCGGGGSADVYALTHPMIGKLALKRVRISGSQQEVDERLRQATLEAETWRGLSHPNILPFYGVLERSGYIYLVSPFVQNGSLSEFTQRHPDVDIARLIREAASGIIYLHRNGIVHGDIKGANILVSEDIRSLLCDFGSAREQTIMASTDVQGIGTVRWQSPELLMSETGKTFKSDVWAFGMTIFEVLSGHIPYYHHDSTSGVIVAVVVHKERPALEPATSPSGLSYASLWEVATDCWHEDPDMRPEIQEAHDRLVINGATSRWKSSPKSEGNISNETQAISPLVPSPSTLRLGATPTTHSEPLTSPLPDYVAMAPVVRPTSPSKAVGVKGEL